MLWLVLALCSAAALGGYEISRKAAVKDNAVLPVLVTTSVAGLITLSALLLCPFPLAYEMRVESLSFREHTFIFGKAVLVSASLVCAYFAVKHLPLSLAAPLRSLSPLLTLIGALILFGESPRGLEWAGMAVLLTGYLGFAWVGQKEGIHFSTNRWVGLLLLGTAIGSTSGLYDKHLLQFVRLPPTTLQFWFCLYNVLLQGALALLLWAPKRHQAPFRLRWTVALVGAFLVIADQFYFRALAQDGALVSIVALVRRSSVLLSFTLGGWLFREQLLKKKALFLLLLLFGLSLLILAQTGSSPSQLRGD